MIESPQKLVQKSELFVITMVLSDFPEALNIETVSQYTKRAVLHKETAELIQDDSELTSLQLQLQKMIRNRNHHCI